LTILEFVLGLRDLEVRSGTAVDIDGLHPHSHYRITVKAITERAGKPEEESVLAETKQSVPDVAPQPSTIKSSVRVDRVSSFDPSVLLTFILSFDLLIISIVAAS
jgi:hypothetical protein